MVDITEVPLANQLFTEYLTNAQGIAVIDAGGMLTSGVFAPPGTGGTLLPVQLVLTYMTAPPSMYQAIRQFIVQRQTAIATELAGMGFTLPPSPGG